MQVRDYFRAGQVESIVKSVKVRNNEMDLTLKDDIDWKGSDKLYSNGKTLRIDNRTDYYYQDEHGLIYFRVKYDNDGTAWTSNVDEMGKDLGVDMIEVHIGTRFCYILVEDALRILPNGYCLCMIGDWVRCCTYDKALRERYEIIEPRGYYPTCVNVVSIYDAEVLGYDETGYLYKYDKFIHDACNNDIDINDDLNKQLLPYFNACNKAGKQVMCNNKIVKILAIHCDNGETYKRDIIYGELADKWFSYKGRILKCHELEDATYKKCITTRCGGDSYYCTDSVIKLSTKTGEQIGPAVAMEGPNYFVQEHYLDMYTSEQVADIVGKIVL